MSSDCLSLIDPTFPLYVASRNYYEEDEDQLEVVAQVEYIVSVGVSLPTDVRESKSLKVFELVDVKDQPEQMMIDTPYLTVLEEFLGPVRRRSVGLLLIVCRASLDRCLVLLMFC